MYNIPDSMTEDARRLLSLESYVGPGKHSVTIMSCRVYDKTFMKMLQPKQSGGADTIILYNVYDASVLFRVPEDYTSTTLKRMNAVVLYLMDMRVVDLATHPYTGEIKSAGRFFFSGGKTPQFRHYTDYGFPPNPYTLSVQPFEMHPQSVVRLRTDGVFMRHMLFASCTPEEQEAFGV